MTIDELKKAAVEAGKRYFAALANPRTSTEDGIRVTEEYEAATRAYVQARLAV